MSLLLEAKKNCELIKPRDGEIAGNFWGVIRSVTKKKFDYYNPKMPEGVVHNTISNDSEAVHLNYLCYLEQAWARHHSIVIRPDIFWYMFLCEMATHIKEKSEDYRDLFTKSSEKTNILVPSSDPTRISLEALENALAVLVPTDINLFFPKFSTETPDSRMAWRAAFCDMVSPYYDYMTFACGFPSIKIAGELEDWKLIKSQLSTMKDLFKLEKAKVFILKVEATIDLIIDAIVDKDVDYFNKILSLRRCGSGSEQEVYGWISNFFMEIPKLRKTENFSSNVSTVKYESLETNEKFKMHYGLFTSRVEDGILTPSFSYLIERDVE